MKKSLSIMIALLIGITHIYAENRELDNGLSFSGDWIGDAIVINDNSTQYDIYMTPDPNNAYATWGTSGDLDTVSGTLSSTHVKIISTGPAKGRITYYYTKAGCGQMSASMDVYKQFNPNESPYNIEISGPDCILEGDTVVYSIKPILTKNLTQGIGVDEYLWSFSSGLVDENIYNAGDGSSVTFVAGAVDDNSSLSVQVGLANASYPVSKTLGKAAPKPEINPICVPYGVSSTQVSVAQPVANVIYSWTCSDDEWGFKPHTGSEVTLIPGNTSSPTITVTAYYEGGEVCSASKTTIKVSRSWANNVSVTSDTVPYKFGREYNFRVTGGVTGGGLSWTPPAGWTITYQDGKEVTMKPENGNSVKLHDSLFVEAALTCAAPEVDRRKYDVYVKPAKVTEITNNGCLVTNTTYKFKVLEHEPGPKATTYKWLVDNIEQSTYTGDSLVWQTVSGKQTISVIPRGAMYDGVHYYWGDTATFAITFQPTPPDSILSSDTCLFVNEEITTTLHVRTRIPGQTYHWSPLLGWTITCDESDSSIVTYSTANAASNSYPIYVHATGEGICGASTQKNYTIKVKPMEWSTDYEYNADDENYKFSLYKGGNLNPYTPKQRALWYIDDVLVSPNPTATITIDSYDWPPQTVRAELTINDCTFDVEWEQVNNVRSRDIPRNMFKRTKKDIMNIYPNPVQNIVNLEIEGIESGELLIYSISGGIVSTESVTRGKQQINTSNMPDGVYYFVVRNANYRDMKKIIIKH